MRALQGEAQRERIGLWQDATPTPPWVWRKAQAAPAY
jgi:endonuclease YncB( thermonuclease family)